LATLELLVHLDDYEVLRKLYSYIEIEIPENLIEVVDPNHLSSGWDSLTPQAASQSVGDVWVKEGRSAVLAVPSIVSQGELNYLLNPSHVDFKLLKKKAGTSFRVGSSYPSISDLSATGSKKRQMLDNKGLHRARRVIIGFRDRFWAATLRPRLFSFCSLLQKPLGGTQRKPLHLANDAIQLATLGYPR
jgi:hypothetical protein